jgi:hypothetical protein
MNKDTVLSHKLVINKNIKEFEFRFQNLRAFHGGRIDYNEIQIKNFFDNLIIVKKKFPNANIHVNINKNSNMNIHLQKYSKECSTQGDLNCYSYL